jgi:alpha-L-fucosidase
VTTQKGDSVYVHVLDYPDPVLTLPALPRRVKTARLLAGQPITLQQTASGLTLQIPEASRDPHDTVIVLELAGK